nr:MAG TPA: hypothetical protein [Caudoviricetes sp.]
MFLMVPVSLCAISRSPAPSSPLRASSSSSSHSILRKSYIAFLLMSILLSRDSLNRQIRVSKVDGLSAGVFHCDRQATAFRDADLCGNINVKVVFYRRRRDGRRCTGQRLSVNGKRRRDGLNRASGGNSDVAAKGDPKQSAVLIGEAAQRDNARTLTMHDTRLAIDRRFGQGNVLACGYAHNIRVCVLCQNNQSFLKRSISTRLKYSGGAIAPPRCRSIGTGPTISPVWGKSYAMQLSAAASRKLVAAIGVLHRVGRNGRGTQLRDQIAVLRRLRRSQLEILVLGLEIGQLALRKEVEDGAAVLVVRVDNVACGVLHGVARVARLRRHVIAYLGDSCAVFAATISGLHLHGVELLHQRRLLICAGQLGIAEAGVDGLCGRSKAASNGIVQRKGGIANAICDTVELALNARKVRCQNVAVHHTAAVTVAKSVAAPAEEEKNNNPDPAVAPHTHTAAVIVRGGDRHSHHGRTIRKRHVISPFNKFLFTTFWPENVVSMLKIWYN